MDFTLPSDSLMLQDTLRRFIQKDVRPLEAGYFSTGMLKPEEWARLRKSIEQIGLWGLTVPEACGGGGLDLLNTCLVEEELGATYIPLNTGDVPAVLYACQGEQVEQYLEPALAGERQAHLAIREMGAPLPQAWKTRAEPIEMDEGRGFILNGCKILSALPEPQDFFIVLAATPEGLSAFLLDMDAPGLTVRNPGNSLLELEGCRVGSDALLGEAGTALTVGGDEGPRAWIRKGARDLGVTRRLLEMGAEHARDWVSFGLPLSVRPVVWRGLADLHVGVESARWLVYHAAWLFDERGPQAAKQAAIQVRLTTGTLLQRAVDTLTMLFNGPGPEPQTAALQFVRGQIESRVYDAVMDWARMAVVSEEYQIVSP